MATLSSKGNRGGFEKVGETSTGSPHVRPPSSERLTSIPVRLSKTSNVWLTNHSVPSGPKLSQGSVARSNSPPAHLLIPGIVTCCQLVPPSRVTLATRPRDPPPDHRSCW